MKFTGRLSLFVLLLSSIQVIAAESSPMAGSYRSTVLGDAPVAYYSFNPATSRAVVNAAGEALTGKLAGPARIDIAGPRPPRYPAFAAENKALALPAQRGFVRVADPGDDSPLDFTVGDSITMEAWVNLHGLQEGSNVYIFGKGRTNNSGFARENQNYALRLRGIDGTARVSFLFRSLDGGKNGQPEYHRYNSKVGFPAQTGWHHVAVSYTFGKPETIQTYLDGQAVPGTWDMGGPTKSGPVVDNDELWIGSALGGSTNNTLAGDIDEVAIYRRALTKEQLASHYEVDDSHPAFEPVKMPEPPEGEVLVQIFEGVPADASFNPVTEPTDEFTTNAFMLTDLPRKYNNKGIIADRKQPILVRMISRVNLSAVDQQLLLRSKDQSQLRIDGKVYARNGAMRSGGGGHESVPELLATDDPDMHPAPIAHQEQRAELTLAGGSHLVVLDAIVGSKNTRLEIGELTAATSGESGTFNVIAPVDQIALTREEIPAFATAQRASLININSQLRRQRSEAEDEYWAHRHQHARQAVQNQPVIQPPEIQDDYPINNDIDRFIAAELAAANVQPAPLTDDWEFLRRVTLDTTGVIPSREEIAAFRKARPEVRRREAIDRLLTDPRYADHWTSYWQDVLAENPNVLKGKLNNTGPFRWWIYESLLDNKPLDRFATELIMMEGSKYYGGPAGFSMATQNDAPMAAKAHVISKAFLGVEMQCARCHDAPYHDVTQEDTFSLAAMLNRGNYKIPKTSVVPIAEGARPPEAITISLKVGQAISPRWTLDEFAPEDVDAIYCRNGDDSRAKLAAIITSPANKRFAHVMANRIWTRLMGRGLVSTADDWEGLSPSHPDLLNWLARELVISGYDQKHLVRLIMNSHTYQRRIDMSAGKEAVKLFATPTRRRMTAEQLVDSLFTASGKPMKAEAITLDPEGRRPVDTFLHLGVPTRAWQFASLSNERDRPALSLPVAQSVIDLLKAYGWRETRQDPITSRESEPTMLQPAVLANGIVGLRAVSLSKDSELTQLALKAESPSQLVRDIYAQVLSREPSDDELAVFIELLSPGFEQREVKNVATQVAEAKTRNAVSWSNHLNAEATKIKLELEAAARAGDPPTPRLQTDWRERVEDMTWTLVNSPEFVFVP